MYQRPQCPPLAAPADLMQKGGAWSLRPTLPPIVLFQDGGGHPGLRPMQPPFCMRSAFAVIVLVPCSCKNIGRENKLVVVAVSSMRREIWECDIEETKGAKSGKLTSKWSQACQILQTYMRYTLYSYSCGFLRKNFLVDKRCQKLIRNVNLSCFVLGISFSRTWCSNGSIPFSIKVTGGSWLISIRTIQNHG